jgi:hypothetical protein
MSDDLDRARTARRQHVHERQAVVFGVLLASLALAGLGAAAVYTDTLSVPFLARDFSTPEPTAGSTVIAPCPPVGTMPIAATSVTVNVYNGSGRAGLAGRTLADLVARGFVAGATGNSPEPVRGAGRISYGTAGVAAAYALRDHVPTAELVLDQRADGTVDFAVGEGFDGLVDLEELVPVDLAVPIPSPTACVALDTLTPVPVVVPTAEPAVVG